MKSMAAGLMLMNFQFMCSIRAEVFTGKSLNFPKKMLDVLAEIDAEEMRHLLAPRFPIHS